VFLTARKSLKRLQSKCKLGGGLVAQRLLIDLHRVLLSPLLGQLVVLVPVGLEDAGNLWHKRIIRVWITEQRTDGQKHLADGQCRRPLRPQDVQTDGAIRVDVWVVDSCREGHLWWLERIVSWEVDGQEEDPSLVWAVWWAHNSGLPVEQILSHGSSRALGRWISTKVLQLLVYTFQSHDLEKFGVLLL